MVKTRFPKTIALELSSACAYKCSYCDRRNWRFLGLDRTRKHMKYNLFKKIIDEIVTSEQEISLTLNYEGESLLNPKISNMLSYCKEQGLCPWISTRLHPASPELIEKLLKSCCTISVSLDLSSRLNNIGAEELKRASEQHRNLELLLDLNRSYQVEIIVTTVLEAGDGIDTPRVREFIAYWIDKVHTVYLYQGIDFKKDRMGYINDQKIDMHLKRRRPCRQPFSFLAVLSDGRVSPCCNSSRVFLRNMDALLPIDQLLIDTELAEFQGRHAAMDLDGTGCENCYLWIEDWLGDEETSLELNDGRHITAFLEGSTIRIDGSPGIVV